MVLAGNGQELVKRFSVHCYYYLINQKTPLHLRGQQGARLSDRRVQYKGYAINSNFLEPFAGRGSVVAAGVGVSAGTPTARSGLSGSELANASSDGIDSWLPFVQQDPQDDRSNPVKHVEN